jgi:hypothetical protein
MKSRGMMTHLVTSNQPWSQGSASCTLEKG